MRLDGQLHAAVASSDEVRVLALKEPDADPRVLAGAGVALLAGLGSLGFVVRRRRRTDRLLEAEEARDRLLDAMVAFGHSGASLRLLDRLRLFLRNWHRVASLASEDESLLGLLDGYENSVLPDLVGLASLAHRAEVRPEHWRHLAQHGRATLQEVRALLAPNAPGLAERLARSEAALAQVDAGLAGIRAHLRSVLNAPLEPVVRRVADRRAGDLAAAGVDCTIDVQCDADQAGFMAALQLEKILENLLENAMRAVAGAVNRRIEIVLAREGAHCLLDVRDTGGGIAEGDYERIFDRDFTTRPGGGFGLYYARQVLARYEGKIFVRESVVGRGTTIRIVLRSA
jgi:signal transduction histidine kinase